MCELTFDNDNDIEQQINLLKLKTCYNAEDKEAIRNAMKATFQHRKAWIEKESPTLDSILSKYPKFILLPNLVIIFLLYLIFFCFLYRPPILCRSGWRPGIGPGSRRIARLPAGGKLSSRKTPVMRPR